VKVKMNLRLFAGWMPFAAMRACGYVAPYDGTTWDNPLPDSAYPALFQFMVPTIVLR
jgi:hypothetical protein